MVCMAWLGISFATFHLYNHHHHPGVWWLFYSNANTKILIIRTGDERTKEMWFSALIITYTKGTSSTTQDMQTYIRTDTFRQTYHTEHDRWLFIYFLRKWRCLHKNTIFMLSSKKLRNRTWAGIVEDLSGNARRKKVV